MNNTTFPAVFQDEIWSLTHAHAHATKRHRPGANGKIATDSYGRGKRFEYQCKELIGPDDLFRHLESLTGKTRTFVIRGAPKPGLDTTHLQRTSAGEDATLDEVPRHWLPLDIDSLDRPVDYSTPEGCELGVREAIRALPSYLHDVSCWWQATSSAGIKPGIRVRLFYWSDRKLSSAELTAWADTLPIRIDASLYRTGQPHYIANPIFDGVDDPVALRSGVIRGTCDVVTLPEIVVAPKRERQPVLVDSTHLVTALLALERVIDDHGDKVSIVCPWSHWHSSDTGSTSTVVFVDTSKFHCSHAHSQAPKGTRFGQPKGTRFGQKEFLKALWDEARDKGSADAMQHLNEHAIASANATGHVNYARGLQELEVDDPSPQTPEETTAWLKTAMRRDDKVALVTSTGAGKTRAMAEELATAFGIRVYLASTVALLLEMRASLEARGVASTVYAGPEHDIPGRGKCKAKPAVADARGKHLPVLQTVCMSCKHTKRCKAKSPAGESELVFLGTYGQAPAIQGRIEKLRQPGARWFVDEQPELFTRIVQRHDDPAFANPWHRVRFNPELPPLPPLSRGTKFDHRRWVLEQFYFHEWSAWKKRIDARDLSNPPKAVLDIVPRRVRVEEADQPTDPTPYKSYLAAAAYPDRVKFLEGGFEVITPTALAEVVSAPWTPAIIGTATPDTAANAKCGFVETAVTTLPRIEHTREWHYKSDTKVADLADGARLAALAGDSLARCRAWGAARVVLFVAKRVEERQGSALADAKASWEATPGHTLDVAHYSATLGMNTWADYDALVTIGEGWHSLDNVDAFAEFYGEDGYERGRLKVRQELYQSHGRLRDIRRSRPVLHIHVGEVPPLHWSTRKNTANYCTVVGPKMGRPANDGAMSTDELEGHLKRFKSIRKAAATWGLSEGSIRHYLAGRRAVPPETALRLRSGG